MLANGCIFLLRPILKRVVNVYGKFDTIVFNGTFPGLNHHRLYVARHYRTLKHPDLIIDNPERDEIRVSDFERHTSNGVLEDIRV